MSKRTCRLNLPTSVKTLQRLVVSHLRTSVATVAPLVQFSERGVRVVHRVVQHGRESGGFFVLCRLSGQNPRDADQLIQVGRGLGVLALLMPVFTTGEFERGKQIDNVQVQASGTRSPSH